MSLAREEASVDYEELALGKLTRVLGPAGGRRAFDETLQQIGVQRLCTADELYAFGDALAQKHGFAGAVGGLIAVAAVMRGAAGRR